MPDTTTTGSGKRAGKAPASPRDILLSEVKTRSIFPLLILHFVRRKPEYGNSIIQQIKELSGGSMSVSPNTVYPLLRRLEEKGYIVGEWEKPETRSRRFYTITPRGEQKYAEIKERFEEHLLRVIEVAQRLHEEIYG
ncbi:MAG: PadR family transcriptional regulator [Rubrobacteraceae bacterium]|uniref:PadR family transcriptional regulator n=1 Tax=Rubrobacter TaxID=42255 RepID=UPI002362AB03|nr:MULTISPECIES: PadR family transcriptional regulator [Rubrobacter]MBX6762533.1 helix-turn-helix transcriptional regulator [Rubrobacteraceae bacterium]MCL6439162.1 PadR family transcriptional regulator [Rubrobacteraceae bacterium]